MSTALKAFSTAPFDVRVLSVPSATFTVCRMGSTEANRLRKAHMKRTLDRRTRQQVEELDTEAWFLAKAKKQILGWEDLVIQGEPIPFSEENLENLCEFHALLMVEVTNEADRVDPLLAEEREKNSPPGESGTSTE